MTTPRLAIVKPEFGSFGGFERHLRGLVDRLEPLGWDITTVGVDARTRPTHLRGLPVTQEMLTHHDDFFLLAGLIERVRNLDLTDYDVVLTTQPPTYLAPHPRKVALFYHHARQFYDLADHYHRARFASEGASAAAVETVRSIERPVVSSVHSWLAGSQEVANRLREFWPETTGRVTVYSAPPDTTPSDSDLVLDEALAAPAATTPPGSVLVVSRLEWPKRVELAVAAIHATTGTDRATDLIVIGGGSRQHVVADVDARLAEDPHGLDSWGDDELWNHNGVSSPRWRPFDGPPSGRVTFIESASDNERDDAYRSCAIVLCPAFREDYGLTALEAMAWGRPVIVCADGGGLTEFVEHGVNGLIVKPTAAAVGAAIDDLMADPARRAEMGEAGRRTAATVTWEAAVDTVDHALRAALGS